MPARTEGRTGMSALPGPLRAALGVVATVLDEARALPEKAPDLPMTALTTALQYSLRAQQRYAELIVRGDELVGRIRGVPDEAPAWATFDDDPSAESEAGSGSGSADASSDFSASPPVNSPAASPPAKKSAAKKSATAMARNTAARKSPAKPAPTRDVVAKDSPVRKVVAKKAATKTISPKTVPAKQVPAKAIPAKRASPAARSGPRLSAFDRVDESAIDDGLVPPID
jgi:hypothetical protein